MDFNPITHTAPEVEREFFRIALPTPEGSEQEVRVTLFKDEPTLMAFIQHDEFHQLTTTEAGSFWENDNPSTVMAGYGLHQPTNICYIYVVLKPSTDAFYAHQAGMVAGISYQALRALTGSLDNPQIDWGVLASMTQFFFDHITKQISYQ